MVYKSSYSRYLSERRKLAQEQKAESKPSRTAAAKHAERQREYALRQARQTRQAMNLRRRFSEENILRLMRTRPAKITTVEDVEDVQTDVSDFLAHAIDSSIYGIRGWSDVGINGGERYGMPASKLAKLRLLRDDLAERRDELFEKNRREKLAQRRAEESARKFSMGGQDATLAGALWHALDTTPPTVGYVYFKRWSMPDGTSWYKVGVSNDPGRRDVEQNVLPVPAQTIVCVDVGNMDRARAIEAVIHKVLKDQRITDSNNRELFHLTIRQAAAVKAVIKKLE